MIELRVHAGLCNRMRETASALALARAAGRPLVVYWLKNRYLNCSFERLFEPIPGVRVVDVETGGMKMLLSVAALRYRLKTVREPIDLFLGNEQIEEYQTTGTDLVPLVAKAQHCVIITYYRFFESAAALAELRPQKDILGEVERATQELDPARLVGVHIRGTDNTEASERSPLSSFLERMRRELDRDPQTKFFLATDSAATEAVVKQHFPGRVSTLPKVFARHKVGGVRDALVDLLVLARCPLILGSQWSSFTDTAAELGGASVELVGREAET